jgi:hypothetical protein
MKRVYSAENSMEVGLIKGMLEQDGINCVMKNQILSGALGEIPSHECWPELWITDDRDLSQAMKLVEAALSPVANSTVAWLCACGEKIEGQFSACWKCGKEKVP